MNTPPRFTEDEIAQMNREAIQIYHAENLALAEKVAAWEALGKELVEGLGIVVGEDFVIHVGDTIHAIPNIFPHPSLSDENLRLYSALSRLLALLNATSQGE